MAWTSGWIATQRMHGLGLWGPSLAEPASVVRKLTAVQAQEHSYARWSLAQRTAGLSSATAIDQAFDDGRFLRTHALRPTWHYVAPEDLRWLIRLSGPRIIAASARRYAELGIDARTADRAADVIAEAVASGPRTRRDLAAEMETRGVATTGQRLPHLLMHAELTGRTCSGPIQGKQHTYAAIESRVPDDPGPDGDEALAELARRYFATRGPATGDDFRWWSWLPAGEARRALELVRDDLQSGDIDGRTYWVSSAAPAYPAPVSPRADLVQCYDETIISYRLSRDVLHTPSVNFKVPLNIGGFSHVILLNGRLLGHWRVRSGVVETRPSRPLQPDEHAAVEAAVDRYHAFLGSSRTG